MEPGSFQALGELFGPHICMALEPGPVDESKRVQGELIVCGEVVRHLNTYVPHPMPSLPHELNGFGRMSHQDRLAALTHPVSGGMSATGHAFAAYRFEVTDAEASNAARLQVLCSTVRVLARLRNKAEHPTVADLAMETVGNWVARIWRVEVPLEGDLRLWCWRQTLRLDVLPNAWRTL